MDCPDADTFASLVGGGLTPAERAAVANHAAACPSCHDVLDELLVAVEATADAVARTAGDGPPPRSSALAPGERIGRYVIESRLGSGGMGVVYAARDPELGRRVAVKILRPGAQSERLRREAQALARLSHPNVVAVHDVGDEGGRGFVAMALVDGVNLRHWLQQGTRPSDEVLRHLIAAGHGVVAAHAAGLIHRDLKPDNIFIATDGGTLVGDFGLAREVGGDSDGGGGSIVDGGDDSGLTRTGTVLGTPAYMAPEQADGDATAASDQFGFCVTAWEALYGARPFSGRTAEEIVAAARAGRIAAPERGRAMPPSVQQALRRGLAADPAARFPSMSALVAALSPRPRWRPWLIAAGAAIAGAAVAAVVIAVAIVGGRAAPEAARPRPEAERRAARSPQLDAHLADARRDLARAEPELAETAARAALTLAEVGRDDLGRAEAGALLTRALVALRRLDEARGQLPQATAALERAGGDAEIELAIARARAALARAAGDTAAQLTVLRQIVDAQRRRHGADSVAFTDAAVDLWAAQEQAGDASGAAATFALVVPAFGADDARRRAAIELTAEGDAALLAGDFPRAIAAVRRALALSHELHDPPAALAASTAGLAIVLELAGELPAALAAYDDAIARYRALPAADRDPDSFGQVLEARGRLLLELGRAADAVAPIEEAHAVARAGGPATRDDVAATEVLLARALLEDHRPAEARTRIESAQRNLDRATATPAQLASADFVLAQALWDTGGERDRDRARALAGDAVGAWRRAREQYAAQPVYVTARRIVDQRLAAVAAWQRDHP